jgi:hypothetical protein
MTDNQDGDRYQVGCDACGTSTTVNSQAQAIEKVERHNYHYGCTYPDQQYIEPDS